jgi:acetyltransferase-like isoleucine patch superfamily enzyme
VIDFRAVQVLWLRCVYAWDRLRFALFCFRRRRFLEVKGSVSPNLRFARYRVEPGGRVVLGDGVISERKRGNHFWLHRDSTIEVGAGTWFRTEYSENNLTTYPGARIRIGPNSLLNGAMVTSKCEITLGEYAWLGFGVRVFDSDLHDLDQDTPERMGPVRIGSRVWIGADVVIVAGVTIGDDVVIGAGSVVTRDIPSNTLAVGVPARPLRSIGSRAGCR